MLVAGHIRLNLLVQRASTDSSLFRLLNSFGYRLACSAIVFLWMLLIRTIDPIVARLSHYTPKNGTLKHLKSGG